MQLTVIFVFKKTLQSEGSALKECYLHSIMSIVGFKLTTIKIKVIHSAWVQTHTSTLLK
jgi:hypothetical protein